MKQLNSSKKSKHLDFLANLGEVVEALARQVAELAELRAVIVGVPRAILEHQYERSPCANIAATREEVAAD